MNFETTATKEYLKVIRRHVIVPLESTSLADSCFAAALLIFGSIDGLGKLIDPDDSAGAGKRFKSFLPRLGSNYAALEDKLWALRNSLAHNSLNVASFMSKTDDAQGAHLETDGDCIFVHTVILLADFKDALVSLEQELRTNATLLSQFEARLSWDEITPSGWRGSAIMTTPPPGIRFVKS